MTNKITTKRALLFSALAVVIAVTMLMGTTFAWFTDTVVSGSNVITSGNLDLDVQYTLDGETWADLNGADDLFQKGLWEPGHTEVVALKLTNAGSLALKYVANMKLFDEIAGKNVNGEDLVLSDILTVSTLVHQANQIGDITVDLAFAGENRVAYQTTTSFKATNVLGQEETLEPDEAHYIILKVDMAETVGNEANHDGENLPYIDFGLLILATQYTAEFDSFDNQYDANAQYPDAVYTATDLQAKIDAATDGTTITLGADIAGDFVVEQKKDVKITIDGKGNAIKGTITVDGKSATYTTAGLTIKDVVFNATAISGDACIRLGDGTNATRYTCNVTVDGCTFDVPGAVGVKSYTGGDKNLTITNCEATAAAHSLVQAKGIDGILVENCTVSSKNGMNFNNSDNVTVLGCTADVQGYAVRFGESKGGTGAAETYTIKDSTLKSACAESGDAVIILRGTADYATLTIVNTTLTGTPDITNTATGATVVQ